MSLAREVTLGSRKRFFGYFGEMDEWVALFWEVQ